jgi:HD superfamily phosphohydrolase
MAKNEKNEKFTQEKVDEILKNEDHDYYKKKLKAVKTLGVAVCGDVLLTKLEVDIVDTPEFQRLRNLKQLGTTYMVYPSAVHTRFEHSLGALKQTCEIVKNIKDNRKSDEKKGENKITLRDEIIVRLLALLHDIGHMPFGHTIEDEFKIFKSHDKHETRWDYFLGKNSTIGKIIIGAFQGVDPDLHTTFFKLIKCEKDFKKDGLEKQAFLYDIVSNTVCADLLDYLDRDALATNLKLSFHPRFLNFFFIANYYNQKTECQEKRIAIRVYKTDKTELRQDIISELIQLLRNRYYLGERVYYHHTKVKTGTMLAGAILRAKEANLFNITEELNIKTDPNSIMKNTDIGEDKMLFDVHLMGDDELILFLKNYKLPEKSDPNYKRIAGAKGLAQKYSRRELYQTLIRKSYTDLDLTPTDLQDLNSGEHISNYSVGLIKKHIVDKKNPLIRLAIEENICEYLGWNSGDVLLYCPDFKMSMKVAKALIENDKETLDELKSFDPDKKGSVRSECDTIIHKHRELWVSKVYINSDCFTLIKDLNVDGLIKDYFQWILFSKNEKEQAEAGERFWKNYYTFYLTRKLGEEDLKVVLNKVEKKEINKLTKELVNLKPKDKDSAFSVISKKIDETFQIPEK